MIKQLTVGDHGSNYIAICDGDVALTHMSDMPVGMDINTQNS